MEGCERHRWVLGHEEDAQISLRNIIASDSIISNIY